MRFFAFSIVIPIFALRVYAAPLRSRPCCLPSLQSSNKSPLREASDSARIALKSTGFAESPPLSQLERRGITNYHPGLPGYVKDEPEPYQQALDGAAPDAGAWADLKTAVHEWWADGGSSTPRETFVGGAYVRGVLRYLFHVPEPEEPLPRAESSLIYPPLSKLREITWRDVVHDGAIDPLWR